MGYLRAKEPERLWASPLRRRIHDHLAAGGPSTAGAMAKALGARFGQTQYHADILKRAGRLRAVRAGRFTYYYLPGTGAEWAVRARIASERPQVGRLIAAMGDGPASAAALGERLGLPSSTARRALRRLEEAGLVGRCHRGWYVRWQAIDAVRARGPPRTAEASQASAGSS